MSEEVIKAYEKAQADLIEKFKAKLKNAAEDVLDTVYCDVSNHADSDAHTNYHNYLKDHFRESLTKEITEDYSHYSWAHGIRMTLLAQYPELLKTKIISDLQDKIKGMEEHIEQLRNRTW